MPSVGTETLESRSCLVHVTYADSESINAKIQWVYTARGFRNKQNFLHAIYFHWGGRLGSLATKMPEAPFF